MEGRINRKLLPEIELDLMNWKAVEKTTEDAIREAKTTVAISEEARREAKFQIKICGGLTSEEEKEKEIERQIQKEKNAQNQAEKTTIYDESGTKIGEASKKLT